MSRKLLSPESFIILLAAGLRLWMLDARPPHFDEGVNGWFLDEMRRTGFFRYDPQNYHGPLHFYILYASEALFGRTIWALRFPVALFGIGCVAMTLALRGLLGISGARIAGLLMAVSPALVYYSRYAIHETSLVFFLLSFTYGLWLLRESQQRKAICWIMFSLAGLALTKETYVIHLAAFAAAFPCLLLWEKIYPSTQTIFGHGKIAPLRNWLWPSAGALLAFVFFYSGNFLNWPGVLDAFATYKKWFATGIESGDHAKPFHYWLTLFARYEWAALVGIAYSFRLLLPSPAPLRFLAIMGCGTLLAYSLIPYKTPWCVISILWPLLLVAGAGFAEVSGTAHKALAKGALLLIVCFNITDSLRLSLYANTDDSEPYVYVQTYHEAKTLSEPLLQKAAANPLFYHARGIIWLESYYPLPWLLGQFTGIGYYEKEPPSYDASFLFIDRDLATIVEPKLTGEYFIEDVKLRSGQKPVRAYYSAKEFADYFYGRLPDFSSKE